MIRITAKMSNENVGKVIDELMDGAVAKAQRALIRAPAALV
jgi:hypothetical protein